MTALVDDDGVITDGRLDDNDVTQIATDSSAQLSRVPHLKCLFAKI